MQSLVRRGLFQKLPKAIKAPFKLVLRREQLYDPELLKLGVDVIKPDDIFLCSYPKSGNTWLRFLIANLLHEEEEVTFRNIENFLPEIEKSSKSLNHLMKRPIMKTHWPFFRRFPRFIYIYRDPRDAMISFHHYTVKNGWFQGNLSEFIRSATPDYYGDWGTHVKTALAECEKRSQDVCLLQYEQMLEQPAESLNRVAKFLGLLKSQTQIEKAVEKSSFDKLRVMEMKHGPEHGPGAANRASGFFRVGKAKQWEKGFAQDDRELLWNRFGAVMAKAGYLRE